MRQRHMETMSGKEIAQYRSPISDALGRMIPDEGELKVWLDDDLIERGAPAGWVHLITAREVCFLLLSGRVVELSLDHDLGDAEGERFGRGEQVIDFLDHQAGAHDRNLWPRDGITLHTSNANGRDRMARAIEAQASKHVVVTRSVTAGGKPRFEFGPH